MLATASRARLSLDIVRILLRVLRRRRGCIEYPDGSARRHTAAHAFPCDVATYAMGIDRVEPSDAELVRRIRAGDTVAYGALVSRYRDRLGRYAVHMIGDREDAEEA